MMLQSGFRVGQQKTTIGVSQIRCQRASVQVFAQKKGKKVEEKILTGISTRKKETVRYRGIINGTHCDVIDNSGAVKAMVIGMFGGSSKQGRVPAVGVGQYCKVVVKRGHKLNHQVMKAIVLEQRQIVRRLDGTDIRFGRNAVALVNNKNEPLGNRIPHFIMREVKYVNQKVYAIGKGGI